MSAGLKWPRRDALEVAQHVVEALQPYTSRIELAGSLRRREQFVGDIEVVAVPAIQRDGLFGEERLGDIELRDRALTLGIKSKAGLKQVQVQEVLGSPLTLDLFMVTPPADWGVIFAVRTGPAGYSAALMRRIKGRGWHSRDGRVVTTDGTYVPCPTEAEFFEAAQATLLRPEDRRNPPGWRPR